MLKFGPESSRGTIPRRPRKPSGPIHLKPKRERERFEIIDLSSISPTVNSLPLATRLRKELVLEMDPHLSERRLACSFSADRRHLL